MTLLITLALDKGKALTVRTSHVNIGASLLFGLCEKPSSEK